MTGGVHDDTTLTFTLFVVISPQAFDAFSQNVVAPLSGPVVNDAVFAFGTGRDASGTDPWYHWNWIGCVPLIVAESVAPDPLMTDAFAGWMMTTGRSHGVTVTVIVPVVAVAPQSFDSCAQYDCVDCGVTL